MDSSAENSVETKKTWSPPELKKINVEELTAAEIATGTDGTEPS